MILHFFHALSPEVLEPLIRLWTRTKKWLFEWEYCEELKSIFVPPCFSSAGTWCKPDRIWVMNIPQGSNQLSCPATGILPLAQWEDGREEEAGVREQYLEEEGEKSPGKQVSLAPLPTEKVIFILGQPS